MFGGFIFGWAKPVPYNPYNLRGGRWGPATVAAAGPAANTLLALFFSLLIRLGGAASLISAAALGIFGWVALLNLMLAVFNLLPVPPLDGSKILFAALPWRLRFIEEWGQRYQFVLFILLLLLVLNSNLLPRLVYFIFGLLTGSAVL
jgi:Zn-dependent protease